MMVAMAHAGTDADVTSAAQVATHSSSRFVPRTITPVPERMPGIAPPDVEVKAHLMKPTRTGRDVLDLHPRAASTCGVTTAGPGAIDRRLAAHRRECADPRPRRLAETRCILRLPDQKRRSPCRRCRWNCQRCARAGWPDLRILLHQGDGIEAALLADAGERGLQPWRGRHRRPRREGAHRDRAPLRFTSCAPGSLSARSGCVPSFPRPAAGSRPRRRPAARARTRRGRDQVRADALRCEVGTPRDAWIRGPGAAVTPSACATSTRHRPDGRGPPAPADLRRGGVHGLQSGRRPQLCRAHARRSRRSAAATRGITAPCSPTGATQPNTMSSRPRGVEARAAAQRLQHLGHEPDGRNLKVASVWSTPAIGRAHEITVDMKASVAWCPRSESSCGRLGLDQLRLEHHRHLR